MSYSDLRSEQLRQIIDVEQVYTAFRSARAQFGARFVGSMSWKTISGGTYLYRKVSGSSRSLGPRSQETERAYESFQEGRENLADRLRGLVKRLDEMAPVNRALGIGRIPSVSGRLLRHLDESGLMGHGIDVVGTNALFAYERMAGIRVDSGLLATGDVDLLFDSRTRLTLASPELTDQGLLGLLRKADRSFVSMERKSYRAVNRDGFMVDLIKPMPKDRLLPTGRNSIGGDDDLHAIEIEGLGWLVNSPKHKVIVIDDRGYPLEVSVPDPRSFALHKAWLSKRADREPAKRQRDERQARLVARMIVDRLPNLKFDGDDLSALPATLRRAAADLMPDGAEDTSDALGMEPRW